MQDDGNPHGRKVEKNFSETNVDKRRGIKAMYPNSVSENNSVIGQVKPRKILLEEFLVNKRVVMPKIE